LRLIADLPALDARRAISALVAADDQPSTINHQPGSAEVAAAFENDLHPVRSAIASALHAGSTEALQGLRHLLPGLLREINAAPTMATALLHAMAEGLASEDESHRSNEAAPISSANAAVSLSEDPVLTHALKRWRSRSVFETDMSSAQLRGLSKQLRDRSIFSARTTNAEYLAEVARNVDDILAGNIGMTEGRIRLMRKLKELGYDPMVGFPQDMANIPPAERHSLQDLSSERRIDLLLETNVRMAQGYAQVLSGNGDYARHHYPAWELTRLYVREIPRGSAESKSTGWEQRWEDAGNEVGWVGASRSSQPSTITNQPAFIALKDSPIWQALGDGAGGYTDTLNNAFPPFAFRSGYAWRAVDRAKCIELGLISGNEVPAPSTATLTPGQQDVVRVIGNLPADLRAEFEREHAQWLQAQNA
jgi:hypothetical protein